MKTRAELAEDLCKAVDNWFSPYTPGDDVAILPLLDALNAWRSAPLDPPATPKLNWRPHTEVPDPKYETEACLIAERKINGGWFLIAGLFYCASHNGEPPRWYPENDWREYKPDSRFFWLPEAELLAALPEAKK